MNIIEKFNLKGKITEKHAKEIEEIVIGILEDYNKFLMKYHYTDDDVWCEKPTAIERFLEDNR